jgi:hypothetical protein
MELKTPEGKPIFAEVVIRNGVPTLTIKGEAILYHEHLELLEATPAERAALKKGGYDIPDAVSK